MCVKNINVSLGLSYYTSKYINIINNLQYSSINGNLTPSISTRFDWNDVMNINIRYRPNYTKNTFDTDKFPKQEFIRHSVNIGTTNYFYKKLEISNDINYTYNPNISDNFDKSSWFWNATLSIKAFDILNQNISAGKYAYKNKIVDY